MKHVYFGAWLLLCSSLLAHAEGFNSKEMVAATMEQMREENIRFIEFAFTDLLGNLKSVIYPISQVEKPLRSGVAFDGSSVPGCSQITESDMLLRPDLGTMHIIPWSECTETTARIMCDIYVDENTPHKADARHFLKQVLAEAHELGYNFFVGPELEFFIFKKDTPITCADDGNYFAACANILDHNARCAIINALIEQGVNIEKWHHEVTPGQHEMTIRYGNALDLADQVVITRHTLKTLADDLGLRVSFMPKPLFGQNGSAMHVHFSLFDERAKRNVFHDENGYAHLSSTAEHFIAGVLSHVHSGCALLNQSINSFKRLVRGYEAPINICWGTKNRSALIRIPKTNENEAAAVRAEIRSPDALCNPYLVFAFILKAGLDGLKNKKALAPAVEDNLYRLPAEQLKKRNISGLPISLEQAIEQLDASALAELFGHEIIDEFLQLKRKEIAQFNTAITDWELRHYL